jgi:hypothetical protein
VPSLKERSVSLSPAIKEAARPIESLAGRLGLIEVLPGEARMASEIRWSAYLVRTALRLGQKGSYLFDPEGELVAGQVDFDLLSRFNLGLASVGEKSGDSSFQALFPGADPVYLQGVIRRVVGYPGLTRRKLLDENDPDNRLDLAFQVLRREVTASQEADLSRPSALVAAHMGVPRSEAFFKIFLVSLSQEKTWLAWGEN